MNKCLLIGRLTKDAAIKSTSSGLKVANFTLAIDRSYKNAHGEKEVDFINCVAWRKTAEIIEKYTARGAQVAISGQIQTRSYEANDGTMKYITEIVVDELQLLGAKKAKEEQAAPEGFTEIKDEDIPKWEEVPF